MITLSVESEPELELEQVGRNRGSSARITQVHSLLLALSHCYSASLSRLLLLLVICVTCHLQNIF